jgi:hypothetical protein
MPDTTEPAKDTTAAAPAGDATDKAAPPATQDPKSTTPDAKADGAKDAPKGEPAKADSFLEATTKEEPKPDTASKDAVPTFKLPEGVKADEPLLAAFGAAVKETGMSVDHAQKLVDLYASHQAELQKAAEKAWGEKLIENRKALEAHPEIGGTNLEKSQAEAKKAIVFLDQQHKGLGTRVATKLSQLGLGDDPDLAHFLTLAGRSMAEDRTGDRSTSTPSQTPEEARMAKRYPTIKGIQAGKA